MKEQNKIGLYIHIPFCVSKCAYCDFLSFGGCGQSEMASYVDVLKKEIVALGEALGIHSLSTVYIGGGTPSILSAELFGSLMHTVWSVFELQEDGEFTIEVNPGTLNEQKLEAYVKYGVNRISMGLQSSDDKMLKDLGRIHSYSELEKTYKMLLGSGIDNISIDVMFGLSGQTLENMEKTLKTVIDLEPKHISAYSLIIEPDTVFEERYEHGELMLPDEDTEREMFWRTHDILEGAGYHHYEISNYAKLGYEAVHNSSYWELTPYIGVGLGASSYYDGTRYKNITDLDKYIESSGELGVIRQVEQVNDLQMDLEEIFFLGLRKLDGIDLMAVAERFGSTEVYRYYDVIDELIKDGLLEGEGVFMLPYENGMRPIARVIRLTRRGVDISNQVMSRFLI